MHAADSNSVSDVHFQKRDGKWSGEGLNVRPAIHLNSPVSAHRNKDLWALRLKGHAQQGGQRDLFN